MPRVWARARQEQELASVFCLQQKRCFGWRAQAIRVLNFSDISNEKSLSLKSPRIRRNLSEARSNMPFTNFPEQIKHVRVHVIVFSSLPEHSRTNQTLNCVLEPSRTNTHKRQWTYINPVYSDYCNSYCLIQTNKQKTTTPKDDR